MKTFVEERIILHLHYIYVIQTHQKRQINKQVDKQASVQQVQKYHQCQIARTREGRDHCRYSLPQPHRAGQTKLV